MTTSNVLADRLKSLRQKLKLRDKSLRLELDKFTTPGKKFAASTFSTALNGLLPQDGEAYSRLMEATEKLAESHNPKIDLAKLAKDLGPVARPLAANDKVLNKLKGAWFLIQYRGKREAPKTEAPARDLRIAIMVFSAKSERAIRGFELIGESTRWEGEVHSHPQDNLLYFSANERHREDVEERFDLVTHHPTLGEKICYKSGIILGVGRGDYQGPSLPIYASLATVWRIELAEEKSLQAPLDPAVITRLRKYCGYIPEQDFETVQSNIETDPLSKQRQDAIAHFLSDDHPNFGDRLFAGM